MVSLLTVSMLKFGRHILCAPAGPAQVPEPCTCICLTATVRHTSVATSVSASAAAICG